MNDPPEPQLRPAEPRRSRPRTAGGVIYLLVAAGTIGGLAVVVVGPWRTGLAWMGVALISGALARLALADHNAGMLKVRRKSFDVLLMLVLGAGLVLLSVAIPDAPL